MSAAVDHTAQRFRSMGEIAAYRLEHGVGAAYVSVAETLNGVTKLKLIERPKPVDNSWMETGDDKIDERFRFVSAAQYCNRPYQRWLIKGVLPQAQLGAVYADYGAGKSPYLLSMCCSMELGTDWHGYRVAPELHAAVLVAEGAPEYKNRLEAYAAEHKVDIDKLPRICADVPNFASEADVRLIAKQVGKLDCMVIDTFAASFIGDENSGEGAGAALANAKLLSKLTGAMIVFAMHPGKDKSKRIRGWSGIEQALDTIIFIGRNGDVRSSEVQKQKGGTEGPLFSFKIKVHELGRDVDDELVTGVTIVKCDAPAVRAAPKEFTSPSQKAIRDALKALAPSGTAREYDVIEKAIVLLKVDPEEDLVQLRKNLKRTVATLVDKELVFRHEGGHIGLSSVIAGTPQADPFIEKPVEQPMITDIGRLLTLSTIRGD
jgi:hypothetical protein